MQARCLLTPSPRATPGDRHRGWHHLRRLVGVALVSAPLLSVSSAAAQERPEAPPAEPSEETRTVARRMAEEAADRFEAGQYDAARDLFHRANEVYPAPTLVLWEARCLAKLGRLVAAEERYAAVERYPLNPQDPDAFRVAVAEAQDEIDRLRTQIPTVTLVVADAAARDGTAEVRIDGHRLDPALLGYPNPLDPGRHVVTLTVRGTEVARRTLDLGAGTRQTVELHAEPTEALVSSPPATNDGHPADEGAAPTPGQWKRVAGWVGVGVGAAGLGTGATAGLLGLRKHGTLEEQCPQEQCPPAYHDDLEEFRNLRTVSTVGYVVGGVGVAAGITLLLMTPRRSSEPPPRSATVTLVPTGVTVSGTF
ncbi:MAG: tetratricopeptide repeat protein [Polyangiaceae bacterium]|nr:tetratricopeptide repeat protein [Polyangiaceae bacterium]